MHRHLEEQLEYNLKTRGMSDSYAEHRRRVSELLVSTTASTKKANRGLTVLGAGNLNDVDAFIVGRHYSRVQLLDIDEDSMRFSANKLQQAGCPTVEQYAIDLSGIFSAFSSAELSSAELGADNSSSLDVEELLRLSRAAGLPAGLAATDCVLSSCVLSQLIHAVLRLVEVNEKGKIDLITELRRKHFSMMLNCLHPGGRAVLITDFVSSETLPELLYLPPQQLPSALSAAVEQGNFFTGCNPFAIYQQLKDMERRGLIASAGWGKPWLWDIAAKRLAVAPFWFQKPTRLSANT